MLIMAVNCDSLVNLSGQVRLLEGTFGWSVLINF